jgi:hypothetical protein
LLDGTGRRSTHEHRRANTSGTALAAAAFTGALGTVANRDGADVDRLDPTLNATPLRRQRRTCERLA